MEENYIRANRFERQEHGYVFISHILCFKILNSLLSFIVYGVSLALFIIYLELVLKYREVEGGGNPPKTAEEILPPRDDPSR